MKLGYYILKDKKIVSVDRDTWAMWFEKYENKKVSLTWMDKVYVSTVFLGIDHNFSDKGPAILFETMVFKNRQQKTQAWKIKNGRILESFKYNPH